jgi:hypothetical protein
MRALTKLHRLRVHLQSFCFFYQKKFGKCITHLNSNQSAQHRSSHQPRPENDGQGLSNNFDDWKGWQADTPSRLGIKAIGAVGIAKGRSVGVGTSG